MITQSQPSKYLPVSARTTPKEKSDQRYQFMLETMRKHFPQEAYDDLYEIIKELGGPIRSSSTTEDIGIASEAFGLRFKKGFSISFFNWGPGDAEKILRENPIDEDNLKDDEVSDYLEGTKLHAFYGRANDFIEKHKTVSHMLVNKTHFESKGVDLWSMTKETLPCPEQRLICLCYVGPMWAISITKNHSKRFR